MKKVGELLKAERERRQLSLHEIGLSLKINPKILSAIEEGDLTQLPAKTFLRGFVRSYAQYLRLNVDEVVNLFHEEMGSTRPEQPAPKKEDVPEPITPEAPKSAAKPAASTRIEKPVKVSDENPFVQQTRGNRTVLIVISLVLVVLIVGVARLVEKYQKERQVPDLMSTPISTSTSTTEPLLSTDGQPAEETAVLFAGATSTTVLAATTIPVTTTSSSTTTSTTTTLPLRTPTPTPTPKPTTTTTVAAKPTPKPTTTTLISSTTVPAILAKPTEVIVEAFNKVSITYVLGTDETKTIELAADQIHTFKSKSKIALEISDGGAINIVVNGQDRGVPGTTGRSIKLTYP